MRFRELKSPRRRAEEYLAAPKAAKTWQGLARQKAELEASVQDYRRLLLKTLKVLSNAPQPAI